MDKAASRIRLHCALVSETLASIFCFWGCTKGVLLMNPDLRGLVSKIPQ